MLRDSVASERGAPSYAESFEPDARRGALSIPTIKLGALHMSASKQGVFSLSQD